MPFKVQSRAILFFRPLSILHTIIWTTLPFIKTFIFFLTVLILDIFETFYTYQAQLISSLCHKTISKLWNNEYYHRWSLQIQKRQTLFSKNSPSKICNDEWPQKSIWSVKFKKLTYSHDSDQKYLPKFKSTLKASLSIENCSNYSLLELFSTIFHTVQDPKDSDILGINNKNPIYVMSKNFIALYVDTLLAFTARAGFLGRRHSRKMPGSSTLPSYLAAKMAEGPDPTPKLGVKSLPQGNLARKARLAAFYECAQRQEGRPSALTQGQTEKKPAMIHTNLSTKFLQ